MMPMMDGVPRGPWILLVEDVLIRSQMILMIIAQKWQCSRTFV